MGQDENRFSRYGETPDATKLSGPKDSWKVIVGPSMGLRFVFKENSRSHPLPVNLTQRWLPLLCRKYFWVKGDSLH